MFLNKLPAVHTPKPVVFGAAIFLAAFYFWFTQEQSEAQPEQQKPVRTPRE
ncbi:hypothetical protein [Alicyclobacillus fastidiosus]|uniref:Uncharacterized protein n=1 Tax=Alicyclobacillus fastidiosus TaxID=392011 RepID=A0ABV5AJ34_9BACL|nr:hypothetical protein [Alicyclobacillus fastidiosus]WEH11569.1 hypothetical protein PYS47_10340 [Alicyclobacillus fastidiosus]